MSRGHRDHLAVQVATVTSSRLIYGSSSMMSVARESGTFA